MRPNLAGIPATASCDGDAEAQRPDHLLYLFDLRAGEFRERVESSQPAQGSRGGGGERDVGALVIALRLALAGGDTTCDEPPASAFLRADLHRRRAAVGTPVED